MTNPDYNYLDKLNEQQREAVKYSDGPSLVIAGAGSGKTRVLTYKIVHLLRMGYEPYRILALTFTNKAAREMKSRISELVSEKVASRLWMGTFHSIFLRIIRRHPEEIGFKNGFTIYDTNDSRSLIKMIVKDLGLDEKVYKAATIASTISNAKNAMMTPVQYERNYGAEDRRQKRPMTARIFQLYVERCNAANAMDFDDILFYTNLLLRDNPDIAAHYSEFFRYVLVDEYQDTNFAQHLIVSQLAKPDNRICVVGDDAQSIYSFRGANISNIINLENAYPGLRTFRLERNYRSTRNIVDAAGSLIEKNTRQLPKHTYSENEKGDPVEVIQTYSDIEEAYIVAAGISQSKLSCHDSLDDYAILYRTNAQSRVLEEALRKRNMPYRLVGGIAFYQRKEVKDMIAYFRMAVNPDDDEALRRIINYPARGIGDTTMRKVQAAAIAGGVSIWTAINNPDQYPSGITKSALKKIDDFCSLIDLFYEDNKKSNAYELGQLIFNRTGVLNLLAHDNTPESISRQENLTELLSGLKEFSDSRLESGEGENSMQAFLSEVSLATDADEQDKTDEPKVTMMTVHAAKGLEFKHVYIVGAEEELFPSSMAMDSLADIEEERRLMYVAITRAEKTCVITYAKSRFRNGQTKMTRPSRFLSDIDRSFLKTHTSKDLGNDSYDTEFASPADNYRRNESPRGGYGSGSSYGSYGKPVGANRYSVPVDRLSRNSYSRYGSTPAADSPAAGNATTHRASELSVGTRIAHNSFGRGEIIGMGHVSGEDSITVQFEVIGLKKLLLRYAKFSIL